MVSRITAAVLTEKALHGTVSGAHWIDLKGKLRLYAYWMTEASWNDPTLQRKNYDITSSTVRVSRFNEDNLFLKCFNPTCVWHDCISEMMSPHISISIWGLWCSQSKTKTSAVRLSIISIW